jgi:hypothetical protein
MTKTNDEKVLFWFGVFCIVVLVAVVLRLSYIAGMQSERFDRAHANRKLQECLDVIVKR